MDKEKFIDRVNIVLYETCGCNKEEAIEVLVECLKQIKACKNFPEDRPISKPFTGMEKVEKWARFVSEHSDREWSRMQAELINSQLENAEQVKLSKEQVRYIKKK